VVFLVIPEEPQYIVPVADGGALKGFVDLNDELKQIIVGRAHRN